MERPSGSLENLSERQRRLLELLLEEKKRDKDPSAPEAASKAAIGRRQDHGPAPLSFAQQRLWFIDQLQPGTAAYNIPSGVRLKGPLRAELFGRALRRTVERHDTLRSTFELRDGGPVQPVAAGAEARLPLLDLRALPPGERDRQAQRVVDGLARRPMSLATSPPWRALLVRIDDTDHVFMTVMHHIISDTWTTGVFFREMVGHYKALLEGGEAAVPALPVQYGDYSTWQRQALDGGSLAGQLEYWVRQFEGAPPLLSLPTDRPRPAVQTFRGGRVTLVLPNSLTDRLKELSADREATLFMTLMAGYQTLLYRYTHEPDLLVGTPMANRDRVELENLIGLFVNTLVLRTRFEGAPTFRQLLDQVRATTLEGLSNHDVPFERVVEELTLERDTSRNPLFQVLFAFQNVPIPELVAQGLTLERYEFQETTARLEVELDLQEMPYGFVGWLGYNADLFDGATIERMARNFRVLLEGIAEDPDRAVERLPLLEESERREVTAGWNRTAADYDREATLHGLFEAQARRRPEALAVVCGDARLSYGELEARANRLANLLVEAGVGAATPVGVYLYRGLDSVVSVLAVLKAGGYYIPLDLAFPVARMKTILQSAGARHLLTQGPLFADLGELHPSLDHVVLLDAGAEGGSRPGPRVWTPEELEARSPEAPAVFTSADAWAYTIFTSGSTGTPKGVMVQHRPVSNLIEWAVGSFGFGPQDQVLFITSLSFDLSVFDVFGLLSVGASIRVATDEEKRDPAALLSILESEPVTFWDSAPAALQQLAPLFAGSSAPDARLRLVFLSGDWIPVGLPDEVRGAFPGARVISLGGATEATVWSNVFPVEAVPDHWVSIPYGRPIQNARYYVLGDALDPEPVNVAGDLFIGGECLAFGYLASPALTAWKFVPDPFAGEPGGRLYRTGDRARFWKDGNLEFLGRLDHQVKIRGYRIELGEIAAALTEHPEIRDAVVLVREDSPGDRRLVAYIVNRGEEPPGFAQLRSFLLERLPEYMVPGVFLPIEGVPTTANGKLDRQALPAPDLERPDLEEAYVDPEGEVEETIAGIWKRVLQVDRVGRQDNFFTLGGHSLLLTQIHGELKTALSADLSLVDLFTYPTVGSLADFLTTSRDARQEVAASLERAAARKGAVASSEEEGVAIIGMALRYPRSRDVGEFWHNLRNGIECIEFFTEEEILAAGVDPELAKHPDYVRAEGTVADVDSFDWRFFGYSTPEEVELIDPQQRIFMEIAWECFERAGYNPFTAQESIGVFGGVNISSYMFNTLYDYDPYKVMSSFLTRIGLLVGNQNDYLCTRLAYHFNLRGPALTVQTACSTATVATHLAAQSLLRNECDLCLAGGVQIRVPQNMGYLYQEGGFPSPDGHCRSFDAKAKGNVHGNGAGVLLLKRLSEAVRDGDRIHAVIRGSAVANDGSVKVGFTAPGVSGQARVAAEAMAVAGLSPEDIGYLEATGTGTELGDPIELEALTKAYRLSTEKVGFCPIGSVKTNIGHTDAASGAAALIKTALALENEEIPPSLHFEEPNPRIDFATSPFAVNTELRPWPRNGEVRRAAVHTYAVGGTNTHVILEEAPERRPGGPSRPWQLLPLSALTSTALHRATENLARYLEETPEELADVAFTLQVGRRDFPMRRVVLCRDREEAVELLRNPSPERVVTEAEAQETPAVTLFLPEEGDLEISAFAETYASEPAFRAAVDEVSAYLGGSLDGPLAEGLAAGGTGPGEELLAPLRFAVLYGLGRLWQSWGVAPRRYAGTGVGDLVAACLAGGLEPAAGARLAAEQGRILAASPKGLCLEVHGAVEAVRRRLPEGLRIHSVAGEETCTVLGGAAEIGAFHEALEADGGVAFVLGERRCPPLPGAAELEGYRQLLAGLSLQPPEHGWLSTVSGRRMVGEDALDGSYWERQLSATIRAAEALRPVLVDPRQILLEASAGGFGAMDVPGHEGDLARQVAALGDGSLPVHGALLRALGEVWACGAAVDWPSFSSHEARRRIPLPTYPFERERIWAEPEMDRQEAFARLGDRGERRSLEDWFYAPPWNRRESLRRIAAKAQPEPGSAETWLVFAEPASPVEEAAFLLRERGSQVVLVEPGEAFGEHEDGRVSIRPGASEDLQRLFETLGPEGPGRVAYGWTLGDLGGEEGAAPGPRLWNLILLARALGSLARPTSLDIVTAGAQEVLGDEDLLPGQGSIQGLARVIPQEYPQVRCRTVDLPVEALGAGAGRRRALQGLLEEWLEEPTRPAVAVRGAHRWAQDFEALEVPAAETAALRRDAVVLLAGGVHPLTLMVAEALAEEGPVRLAFLGESGLPPRRDWQEWIDQGGEDEASRHLRRLLALEEQGASVWVMPADLQRRDQAAAAVDQVLERWGEVHGVFFTTGELAPEYVRGLAELDEEFLSYRIAQRLRSLEALEAALGDRPLDFFWLSSTVASVLGGLAVAVEASADAYLDTLARKRRLEGLPYLSLGWDAFRFGHEDPETSSRLPRAALAPEEGKEVVRRLLGAGLTSQVVISTTDLPARIDGALGRAEPEERGDLKARPMDLPQEYLAPRNEVEEEVAAIWSEVLGVDRVGVEDNYFDLGGNSLLATQLVSRLRGRFQVELALQSFFEGATVANVAKSIDLARWAGEQQAQAQEPVLVGGGEEVGEI